MNKQEFFSILLLILLLIGFISGFVAGYFSIGRDVEKRCRATIESYDNYIAHKCVNPLTPSLKDEFNLTINWSAVSK